jgi:hypothetical protein
MAMSVEISKSTAKRARKINGKNMRANGDFYLTMAIDVRDVFTCWKELNLRQCSSLTTLPRRLRKPHFFDHAGCNKFSTLHTLTQET